jgi:glyoxylase-like metal-dependent hydrolase (beta-lactamase superfamily II)
VAVEMPERASDAVAYRDELVDRGQGQYLIDTHQPLDHVAGNYSVPGRRISHEPVREAISIPPAVDRIKHLLTLLFSGKVPEEKVATVEDWSAETFDWAIVMRLVFEDLDPDRLAHLAGSRMTLPESTFTDEAALHVGDSTFELLAVPGHVESHVSVPEQSVLFAGDTVTTACYPSMAASVWRAWLDSLDRQADLDVDHIFPGDGPVAGPDAIPESASVLEAAMGRVAG